MANAINIAKQMISSGEINKTVDKKAAKHLSATAPDAFAAQTRIMEIAMSETGKPPEKEAPPPPPKEPLKVI